MVRIPLDLSRGIILINAHVIGADGEVALELALDTGASMTTIRPRIVRRIGHDPADSERQRRVISFGGVETVAVVTLPRLEALGKGVNDLDIVCRDLPPQTRLDGVLGLNFLRYFDIRLNFPQSYLEING